MNTDLNFMVNVYYFSTNSSHNLLVKQYVIATLPLFLESWRFHTFCLLFLPIAFHFYALKHKVTKPQRTIEFKLKRL
ncbi:hypothetical protein DOS84_10250 [Flavobacterium aquariorum]|uniref:Uncharacterized protein n=1 Tax=Flavobacterium aquariorum TaxID=2217670 RepID=A0A2W7UIN5_9FLAO|nr:hypothetical protein DOS84_10250 [Flavobacterium aquariorum]